MPVVPQRQWWLVAAALAVPATAFAVIAGRFAGLLFGAGRQEQTTPETDGGNLINKTIAYHNSGGAALT